MDLLSRLFDGDWPRLVIFDLDGTLLDSVPDLAAAVDSTLLAMGRPAAGVERVRDWVGNGAAVLLRRALAGSTEHAAVDDALAAEALQHFLVAYAGEHSLSRVYPGVIDLLQALRARGVLLALATNKPMRFVDALLAEKQLDGYFNWSLGGDSLPQQKPDPAPLNWIMSAAAVPPHATLFVGDSRNDIQAARAAGVKVVAVSYGYNHGRPVALENPDLLVDSLDALI